MTLREEMRILMTSCYSKELSACPKHPIFQPQKAINLIIPLIIKRVKEIENPHKELPLGWFGSDVEADIQHYSKQEGFNEAIQAVIKELEG